MTSSFADANITVIIDYISCLGAVMYGSHLLGSCFAFLDTLKYGKKKSPKTLKLKPTVSVCVFFRPHFMFIYKLSSSQRNVNEPGEQSQFSTDNMKHLLSGLYYCTICVTLFSGSLQE